MPIRIYALRDPSTGVVRYIGQTSLLLCQRLARHRFVARSGESSAGLSAWLATVEPERLVLEVVESGSEADDAEAWWIAYYRGIGGGDLLNETSGRKAGFSHSDESRARMSASHTGKTLSDEHKAKIGAESRTRVRKPFSAEARAKMSAAARKRPPRTPHSEETKAKMRASHLARRAVK